MKFRILYIFSACIFLAGTFYNFQSGPAAAQGMDRTGSPIAGSGGQFCGQCHNAGNFAPVMEIQLFENGDPVTKYEPGKTYQLEVSITATDGTPAGYGFQAVALDDANAGQGTFNNLPADVKITDLNGIKYVEQGKRLSSSTLMLDWTAPTAGAGDVTIYASGVAANGNNGNSMDGSAANSLKLGEGGSSSTLDAAGLQFDLQVMANPIQDVLPIKVESSKSLSVEVRMLDLNGRAAMSKALEIMPGEQTVTIDAADLEKGIYFLQLTDGQSITTKKVLKL